MSKPATSQANPHISLELTRLRLLEVERDDTAAWRAMDFDETRSEFVAAHGGRRPEPLAIRNGAAAELAAAFCADDLRAMHVTSHEAHAPPPDGPPDGDVHEAMCSQFW